MPSVEYVDLIHTDLGPRVQTRTAETVTDIEVIIVDADTRQQGIGAVLPAAAETEMRAAGRTITVTRISPDNTSSQAWFTKRGYCGEDVPVGITK
ncbi:GNAT family N-acetyltransferase [Streptomyces sp. NPDC002734]|uniref:GNAT family N-acetyltransferase n=1 Tax=Streptomyces sp. NPDC002734 TaxID=3154426 RepID=UPI003316F481